MDDPLFVYNKSDCVHNSEIEETFRQSDVVSEFRSELYFPPAEELLPVPKAGFELSGDSVSKHDPEEVPHDYNAIELAMIRYLNVLNHFNEFDLNYGPFDLIFHSPPYTGRHHVPSKSMKGGDFDLLARRLNVQAHDRPYKNMKEALASSGINVQQSLEIVQEISNQSGSVVVFLNNDLNNRITTY